MKKLLSIMLLSFCGCTDAGISDLSTFGHEAHVRCFSGGQVVFEADSTGSLEHVGSTEIIYFRNKATGKVNYIMGTCVSEN